MLEMQSIFRTVNTLALRRAVGVTVYLARSTRILARYDINLSRPGYDIASRCRT